MPSIFKIGGYTVFFWSNENGEPIHVHIGKGRASGNATKIWLTAAGGCVVAHNGSQIPLHELSEMLDIIAAQFFMICAAWRRYFNEDTIRFYC
ncbi:MAG: DUF4160 domain-containing protein [Pseudoflavonifractor sp.]